jgi:hypothetical protein
MTKRNKALGLGNAQMLASEIQKDIANCFAEVRKGTFFSLQKY